MPLIEHVPLPATTAAQATPLPEHSSRHDARKEALREATVWPAQSVSATHIKPASGELEGRAENVPHDDALRTGEAVVQSEGDEGALPVIGEAEAAEDTESERVARAVGVALFEGADWVGSVV